MVSVILSTYNWSEVLHTSIASVLSQTYRDFELLVIGDCCTDNSEEVALSFGDSRAQWHNLPFRVKSQSGPNNYGNEIAAGALIAYLGHDDVWHPDHLQSLVDRIDQTGADMACAVTVMYGPPGSGIRGLSGIFVEGRYRRDDFVPPSSLMHKRSLIARIGAWRHPEEIVDPVDCDFLRRAHEAGSTIVSTERLTVFKFNAAWRRDSYIRRDVSEQREVLSRLESAPAECVAAEWAGLLRATREKRLIEMRMPADSTGPLGRQHHTNLRNRGLEDVEAFVLSGPKRFLLDNQPSALEWHELERYKDRGPFRWSGPSPTAVIALPVVVPPRFRLRLQVLNWLQVDIAAEVTLRVANRPVAFVCRGDGRPELLLEAVVSDLGAQPGPLRIQLHVERLRCPFFDSGGTSPDQRWLGICVGYVEIEPLSPEV